jgi:hypothetical protein
MRHKLLLWCVPAALAAVSAALLAAPAASAGGGRARFDFAPGGMDVAITGHGRNAARYYLTYTLTNPMDEARTPRLYLEVKTDTNKTYGDFADAAVVKAASKATKTAGIKATADLRGAELPAGGTVSGVANFGNIDPNADDITVRVHGLWDPIIRTRQGKVLKETRILVLKFERHGDEYDRPMDPIKLVSTSQEVEGEVVELYSTTAEKKK